MKVPDFKRFVFENNIKQIELVQYLGLSKGYISLVVKGEKGLSEENFRKLLDNPYGWDTSMLTQSEAGEPAQAQSDILIAELRAQIEKLEAKVDSLNQELGEKNALLKMMRQGGSDSVHAAEDSSSTNVG